jgi:transcriptional regulator with XRE-family HTH domain
VARAPDTLASTLRAARSRLGLTLRDVERRTGIRSAHLSQLETGTIAKPEMALLWELALLYELEFGDLLRLAGHAGPDTSGERRQRMTVALRALGDLTAEEQAEALQFMAQLRRRRGDG